MKWIPIFIVLIPFACTAQEQILSEEWVNQNYDLVGRSADGHELGLIIENNIAPIDINQATRKDLQNLHILNENEINEIINYRKNYGPFISVYELQAVQSISSSKLKLIQPFIYVSSSRVHEKKLSGYTLIRVDRIMENKIGYSNGTYLGSPFHIISRTRLKINNFKFGLTLEKDPGEKIDWQPNYYGADHVSGFISFEGSGFIKKIILGNFTSLWGQGLVIGGGFGLGKGRESILSINRSVNTLSPYSSISEWGYFTGAGFTMVPGKIQITGFLSKKRRDGYTINDIIQTLPVDGLHRSPREFENRKSIFLSSAGLNISYINKQFKSGLSLIGYRFDNEIKPTIYKNKNQQNIIGSISYRWHFRNIFLFGESAITSQKKLAHIHGGMISMSHSVDAAFSIRSYSKYYYSPFSNQAFRESSETTNEKGTYLGIKVYPSSNITLTGFADIFSRPKPTFSARGPSTGTDFMLNLIVDKKSYRLQTYLRVKSTERNYKDPLLKTYSLQVVSKTYGNIDAKIPLGTSFLFRLGYWFSKSRSRDHTRWGSLIYHDIKWTLSKTSISVRFALIDVPFFENRFYVYEPDVLYAFSIPAYYGQAIKYFILIRHKMSRSISLWAKFSRISFRDRNQIGSGSETIFGNKKTEARIQLAWKF